MQNSQLQKELAMSAVHAREQVIRQNSPQTKESALNSGVQTNFTRRVARVSQSRKIMTHEDVISTDNMKLVGKQTQITAAFFDKLIKHKLLKPLENSLTIEGCINAEELVRNFNSLDEHSLVVKAMQADVDNRKHIFQLLRSMPLPAPLSFKLSILREEMPETYLHSLIVAYISVNIGIHIGLEPDALVELANAGLFHDIAVLHLDNDVFAYNSPISYEQRKQVYAHPLIAALMLKEFPGFAKISLAIEQHHERLDGSGYPRGLASEQISLYGQILALAELAASLETIKSPFSYQTRLMTALRFNSEHYPLLLKNLLSKLNYQCNTHSIRKLEQATFIKQLNYLWLVFDNWYAQNLCYDLSAKEAIDFVSANVERLKHALTSSGLSLNVIDMDVREIDMILEDPEEIPAILAEAQYQLINIVHEVKRRWPRHAVSGGESTALMKWIDAIERLKPHI